MKKVFAILTVVLLIAAMFHISVARHYCGGELAASKISLTGDLAGCGMEDTEESCPADPHRDNLKSHCCDDVVTFYGIDNNYTKSPSVTTEKHSFTTQAPEVSVRDAFQFYNRISHNFTDVSPPSSLAFTAVDLTEICVFRI